MFSWVEKTAGSMFFFFLISWYIADTKGSLIINVMNRYSTFVNWELWWPNFPVLVYFKETQTKPEGQIHFFPVIFVSILVCPWACFKIMKPPTLTHNSFTIAQFCYAWYLFNLLYLDLLSVFLIEWEATLWCYGGASWSLTN